MPAHAYHNRSDFRRFVVIAAIAAISARFAVISSAQVRFDLKNTARQIAKEGSMTSAASRLPIEGELPPLANATEWLNSQPLTAAGLRGKVVLIEFWTYTCINWRRQLPYVRAWAAKYKDQGLVVIGVHTPEFGFERDINNLRRAAGHTHVDYPIAIDSDYAVWRAFNNEYWPALYFVDAKGRIRHHQFGEGEYEQSERIIQQLLAEAGTGHVAQGFVSVRAYASC